MSESDKYEVLEKIGHGSFGVIRKVRRKADGMILCRKEISYLKMSQKEREQLHAEFQILSSLRHPNIVGYYHREHLKASQDLHLYMEYCGNGDLGRVIRSLQEKNQYAEESFVWSIFSQLVTALYRCHYGVDPPEVGKNVLGLGTTARPKPPPGAMTILHRDLKPENVFLGEDNSVKLGDFGLSKVMQSHDFASTYVGTPFYMSPEICAAEKYTLKSDIWSLGCIIYELCTREPPFNAKTHFQLVQKIKEGKIAPLPAIYSAELFAVIKDCLRVNPDRRPDTAMLLNLPVVRLMRKEKEVVDFSKTLKAKEEALNRRIRELDQKMTAIDQDKASMRQEIDASLRREWEVKARLEIDRLVAAEIEQLQRKFEQEVQMRVEMELQNRKATAHKEDEAHDLSSSISKSSHPQSSVGSVVSEFPSTTDISEFSVESPDTSMHPLKKSARTPFARAQTMFAVPPAGTPMDVEMASPSPMTIASLSLSPRRNAATRPPTVNPANIFSANQMAGDARWETAQEQMGSDSESDDEINIPSPTRMIKSSKNPFTSKARPQLHAQKSMPAHRLQSKQSQALQGKTIPVAASTPDLQTAIRAIGSNGALQDRSNSPNRRLSKIPSAANLKNNHTPGDGSAAGLNRKPSLGKNLKDGSEHQQQQQQPSGAPSNPPQLLSKAAAPGSKNNNIRGRTLVELQQARAGGRPLSAVLSSGDVAAAVGGASNFTTTNAACVSPVRAFREHAAAANRGATAAVAAATTVLSDPPAVWDPERDEMPSPFLVRRKPVRTN
ncbi:1150d720-13cd-4682-9ae7-e8e7bf8c12e1 [Thermothielavioides terrestris]|uniref:non-specific serine/threonine protein kinase n=1 Tax=Thermothielavioides terrestris TaxID=2587410 RepID=A0A3S4EUR3_9PEZI|nr:1150d720-13cd-4682-9ae7-e8e7bf8c12e1 [Thermothielavioides terrestris]